MLMERGARADDAVFSVAIRGDGNTDPLNFLLDEVVTAARDVAPSGPESAFCTAAKKGDPGFVRLMLARADEETIARYKRTRALHLAVSTHVGHENVVEFLLDQGFDIETRDISGQTPLFSACSALFPSPEVIEMLLARGADVAIHTNDGDAPWTGRNTPRKLAVRFCKDDG